MAMAKIWRNRIEGGTKAFEECPDRYKEEVLELIQQDVQKGKISKEKYKELTGMEYPETAQEV